MKVFVTGATGFIGSRPLFRNSSTLAIRCSDSLVRCGRSISDRCRGRGASRDLEDLESLRSGAAKSDGVIHLRLRPQRLRPGFFEVRRGLRKGQARNRGSRRRARRIGPAASSSLPEPGWAMLFQVNPQPRIISIANHPNPRKGSEVAGASVAERGVNVSVVRLPQVHDTVKQGLITYAVQVAREKGVSAYIGEGLNRWPAAHVLDVAHLYRLALEKHEAGSRYNAVAEEGVPMREIAAVIGKGLKVPVVSLSPEKAQAHFGWLSMFAGFDMPASSALTRQRLGWTRRGPGSSPILRICSISRPEPKKTRGFQATFVLANIHSTNYCTRLRSIIQSVSHVLPPSVDSACSQ